MQLTREQILAMEAGSEMDAIVAQDVMNAPFVENCGQIANLEMGSVYVVPWHANLSGHNRSYRKCAVTDVDWSPSTDIAAAWEALESWSGDYELRRQNDRHKCELFLPSREWESRDKSAPVAICRALLFASIELKSPTGVGG